MGFLDDLHARVERTRDDDAAHAIAVVELAEGEPLLGHRLAPVREAIERAAQVLDRVAAPELRARLLLRLAQLKLVALDLEGADQALAAVAEHVPEHVALRFLTGVRACRVALRRGPAPRAEAADMLLASAARLPSFDAEDSRWQEVATEIVLGIAELEVHADPPDAAAFAPLRALIVKLAAQPGRVDAVFTGRQLLATCALSLGDLGTASTELRALIDLARTYASPEDEIEARLALAGALVEGGDPIGHEEATHHVHRAQAAASEHGFRTLHQATLLAEAGVLARAGKTASAIDRMLELARAATAAGDVAGYVAAVGVMAELYARSGDVVSAFRTIVESHRALADATGSDATALFRPHLAALRDRIGGDRLEQIAADVARANALVTELSERTPRDPS